MNTPSHGHSSFSRVSKSIWKLRNNWHLFQKWIWPWFLQVLPGYPLTLIKKSKSSQPHFLNPGNPGPDPTPSANAPPGLGYGCTFRGDSASTLCIAASQVRFNMAMVSTEGKGTQQETQREKDESILMNVMYLLVPKIKGIVFNLGLLFMQFCCSILGCFFMASSSRSYVFRSMRLAHHAHGNGCSITVFSIWKDLQQPETSLIKLYISQGLFEDSAFFPSVSLN